MDIFLIGIAGVLVGGLVNALTDELPFGRAPGRPRYPNGAVRPLWAWLGISALLFRLRQAEYGASQSNKLSWRYPLTELLVALLYILTYVVTGSASDYAPIQRLIFFAYVAIFVLLAVVDIEHRRILLLPLAICAAIALVEAAVIGRPGPDLPASLAGCLFGAGLFCFLYLGGKLFGKVVGLQDEDGPVFGIGDVYLMALGGLIVAFPHAVVAAFLTIMLGGFGAILYLLQRRLRGLGYERFTALPYGPYILVATYLVLLFQPDVTSLLARLF